ncbi:MAG: hypothetical protein JRH08_18565 [Deltaproteobacteria bacterium]|nr:hypothetical protein [Deltaproteobacteria bacterium]MBW2127594.1 hypothetical protein [Deltaproteobacteria bacterium]
MRGIPNSAPGPWHIIMHCEVIALQEKLKLLIQLQDCDNRITDTRRKRDDCPLRIAKLEKELEAFQATVQEDQERLEALKKERREVERDIDDAETKKRKSQAKLSSVSSNKEYRAALKEIDELDRTRILLEDKALELMEQIETLEEKLKASKKELEGLKEKIAKDKKAIEEEMKTLEQKLTSLAQERDQLCRQIEPPLLSRYDLLRERKGGLAISPVTSGVCQTCHMGIPPQKFNELIRGEELMSCPNCQRIIYWGDNKELKEPAGSSE